MDYTAPHTAGQVFILFVLLIRGSCELVFSRQVSETELLICGGLAEDGQIANDLFTVHIVAEMEIVVTRRQISGLGEALQTFLD